MNSGPTATLRVSVIVCTHNPRKPHLRAALDALQQQDLDACAWELVVVDNASTEPLSQWVDVRWHPNGRIVHEEALGLTRARLRGIKETQAPLLVFVDDDNVLASDYLTKALAVAGQHASLGIWSGSVELVFDEPPPAWTEKYWAFLVHRPIEQEQLSQT